MTSAKDNIYITSAAPSSSVAGITLVLLEDEEEEEAALPFPFDRLMGDGGARMLANAPVIPTGSVSTLVSSNKLFSKSFSEKRDRRRL